MPGLPSRKSIIICDNKMVDMPTGAAVYRLTYECNNCGQGGVVIVPKGSQPTRKNKCPTCGLSNVLTYGGYY